ncbi:MAG TPA: hypothetical protein VFL79_19580, partial [Terriglobia bacterium]|nr:hypothetical protein [Terriglobia bacterium]
GEYITAPTASLSGASATCPGCVGTNPALNVGWTAGASNGQVTGIKITNGGSGYAASASGYYQLAFSGGGGSGAQGNASSSGSTTYVSGITLTNGGSGYISPPLVTISGTPGSGATATAALTGGQQLYLGPVYMLTSLAVTKTGARAMAQMEVGVTPPTKFQLGGALTLAGANPNFSTPNSAGFVVNGNDAAAAASATNPEPSTCNGKAGVALPSIGVADSIAQSCVANGTFVNKCGQTVQCNGSIDPCTGLPTPNSSGLGKPDNYIGVSGTAPDVQVVPGANPDPSQLTQTVNDIYNQPGTNLVGPTFATCTNSASNTCGSFTNANLPASSATNLQTTVVNGNLTISGSTSGYGVLVVTGNLILNGDFTWHGLVLVIGAALTTENGGGQGQITGSMYVGNTSGAASTFTWNGGGGNGIQYDHCWADDLLSKFPPNASDQPLQVLSTRMLEY